MKFVVPKELVPLLRSRITRKEVEDMLEEAGYITSISFDDLTSHPTSLAGYGITDAKIVNGTITLGTNTITPITSETDPTVPAWAKASTKPNYNLDEVLDGTTRKLSDYALISSLGTAAYKNFTTSILQDNADLPTAGAVYSAIAAAVTSALHYRGMSSTALTDGGTETAIISGVALVPQSGDVVIYDGFEFLWENNVWNKLGDDSSYALKTITVSGDGTYITGGGDLTAARTFTLSNSVITSLGKANSALQSSDIHNLTLSVNGEEAGTYNPLSEESIDLIVNNFKTIAEETEEFTERNVPGIASGDVVKVTGVKGKTIVWNQAMDDIAPQSNGFTMTITSDSIILNALSQNNSWRFVYWDRTSVNTKVGDKWYLGVTISNVVQPTSDTNLKIKSLWAKAFNNNASTALHSAALNTPLTAGRYGAVLDVTSPMYNSWDLQFGITIYNQNGVATTYNGTDFGITIKRKSIVYANLTQMFGVGNEPTAEQFEALYPLDYYDYSTNTLVSNSATGIEMLSSGGTSLGTFPLDITSLVPANKPTLRLNQLVQNGNFADGTTGWSRSSGCTYSVSGGIMSVGVEGAQQNITCFTSLNTITGHKYYVRLSMKITTSLTGDTRIGYFGNSTQWLANTEPISNFANWATRSVIITSSYNNTNLRVGGYGGNSSTKFQVGDTAELKDIVCIDLTEMYGAGNEPTNTALIEEQIGSDYIQYNTGTDIPNRIYPKGAKSAGTPCDVIRQTDTDRVIGVVDLGTLNWSYQPVSSSYPYGYFRVVVSGKASGYVNMLCAKYPTLMSWTTDKVVRGGDTNAIYVIDSAYTNAATFKAAMSGVYLYYEQATPEHFDLLNPLSQLVACDPDGTQRRLPEDTASSVSAPMVCDFQYGVNPSNVYEEVENKIEAIEETLEDPVKRLSITLPSETTPYNSKADLCAALSISEAQLDNLFANKYMVLKTDSTYLTVQYCSSSQCIAGYYDVDNGGMRVNITMLGTIGVINIQKATT